MKPLRHSLVCSFLLSLIGLLTITPSSAAGLSLIINPAHPAPADPAYPGAGSTVTTAADPKTGLTASIAGRNYGVNPAPGQPRWGLRTDETSWNPSGIDFIVTNGFTPAVPGAKTDRNGNPASYVSITVGNVLPNTLFQNLSIDFNGLNFTRTTNAWAGTSVGQFSNWTAANTPNEVANGGQLSVTLPSFVWSGGDPLEIRVYGLVADDVGGFASVRIQGNVLMTPLVPEPAGLLFGGIAVAWFCRRRR
jgi:hypothetical protein